MHDFAKDRETCNGAREMNHAMEAMDGTPDRAS